MTAGTLIQLPLVKSDVLDPLPTNAGHYVAVLQSRPGEREALSHVSAATWKRLTPLVEVVGPRTPTPILTSARVKGWIKTLWKALGKHPFYLDVLRLKPAHPVETKSGTAPVLECMYEEARRRAMRFVPVVHVGQSSAASARLVADAALLDGHGVGLRYRCRKVMPSAGKTRADLLRAQLADVGVAVEDADLLFDFEFLDVDHGVAAYDVASLIREVYTVGHWRSIVLIATSIPKMLGGPNGVKEGTTGTIERREWRLWSEVAQCDLPRIPAFGDYAIQNPEPPQDDIKSNTMRANVRYTAARHTIVARGRGPVTQEGNAQYHDLCKQIGARAEFSGPSYSWGDSVIIECAQGVRDPGAQGMWRGAGTSHHLQFVTDQVRARQQTGG